MKYIFLDIDGTLFDHNTFSIPESAYRAVELAKSAGHKIFICTGRSCCMLEQVKEIDYDGVVAAAGAYVEAEGKLIFEESMDNQALQEILTLCLANDVSYILEGNRGVYMHTGIRDYFNSKEELRSEGHGFFGQSAVHGIEAYQQQREKIYKFCIYNQDLKILKDIERRIGGKYHFVFGQINGSYPLNAEVTYAKNNKATGIKKILEYFDADIRDAIAIGDSMNDLEMLKECGTAIAMGNADERVKVYADYVTTDIDKNGIYNAFEKFNLFS